MAESELTRTGRLLTGPGPRMYQGIATLVAARSLDVVTTVLGLALVPRLQEANPVAATVFEECGVLAGSLFLSVCTLAVVTLTTELGVRVVERAGDLADASALRYLGYGLPAAIAVVAALHNARLIVAASLPL